MNKQIEQLIEKQTKEKDKLLEQLKDERFNNPEAEMERAIIDMQIKRINGFISDLKSLQEPTEEKCKADTFRDDGGAYYNNIWK